MDWKIKYQESSDMRILSEVLDMFMLGSGCLLQFYKSISLVHPANQRMKQATANIRAPHTQARVCPLGQKS